MRERLRWGASLGVALVVLGAAGAAWASKVKASCYLLNKDGSTIQGVHADKRYEIASVSKVMTTYWAVTTLGLDHRFETRFHVFPVNSTQFDIHIEGGQDPFFNREQLQFAISELNHLGVREVRNLSFDQNFKFLESTRDSAVSMGHYGTSFPRMDMVETQLKSFLTKVNGLYSATRQRAKKIGDINLPETLEFKVKQLKQMKSDDFVKNANFSGTTARHLVMQSVPLQTQIKEMNRTSNNYVANLIFQFLGGAEAFQKFIKAKVNLEVSQIRFLNGSGDRYDYLDGTFAYNEASCEAIIAVIGALKAETEVHQSSLAEVLAVAGRDAEGEKSTVSNIYNLESTSGALIAKTGTVNPSIVLAGLASTDQGDVYFGYIYGTNGTAADQRDARGHIRQDVVKLFQKFGQKKEIDFVAEKFMTFDSVSALEEEELVVQGTAKP